MNHIFVRSERVIDAKPTDVYKIVSDYQTRRPRLLPPNYRNYAVKKGGKGGGTVIKYHLRAAGRERPYEMHVEETVKGQVLTERDKHSSLITRWSVLPVDSGQKSKVSIETDWEGSSGIGGFFERTFAPLGLRNIYKDILIGLALMVQPPEQNEELLQRTTRKRVVRTGAYTFVLGLALALTVWVKYLRMRV